MGNRITTIRKVDIIKADRFEPKLFMFQSALRAAIEKYDFISLDEISTEIKRGQSPKPDKYRSKDEGKYIFVRTADVKKFHIDTEGAVYIDEATFATQRTNRIKGEDILISVVGNYLGSTSVIPSNIEIGAFNDNSARIRITDETVSPYYVSAFFNSVFGQQLILSLATRTGQKILSAGNVKKLSLPKISNINISKKYRDAIQMEIESNNLILRARNLFYKKIDIDFKSVKKENIFSVNKTNFANADLWTPKFSYPLYVNTLKTIQRKWPTVNVGEIADVKKGNEVGSDLYISYIDKRRTDVPFIRTSDIVNYVVDQFPDFYIPCEIYEDLNQNIQANDILFTNDGKIGQVAIITNNDNIILQSHINRIRVKRNKYSITPEYLFTALSIKEIGRYQAQMYTVVQSTIPTMSGNFTKIQIPILDSDAIFQITELVKNAISLKDERKCLITEVKEEIDSYFDI